MTKFDKLAKEIELRARAVSPLEITRDQFKFVVDEILEMHENAEFSADDYARAHASAIVSRDWVFAVRRPPPLRLICKPISLLTQTQIAFGESEEGLFKVTFTGFKQDVALAVAIMDLFDALIEQTWREVAQTRAFKDASKSGQTNMRREHQQTSVKQFAEELNNRTYQRERQAMLTDDNAMVEVRKRDRITQVCGDRAA